MLQLISDHVWLCQMFLASDQFASGIFEWDHIHAIPVLSCQINLFRILSSLIALKHLITSNVMPNLCCHMWWMHPSLPISVTFTPSCVQSSQLKLERTCELVWMEHQTGNTNLVAASWSDKSYCVEGGSWSAIACVAQIFYIKRIHMLFLLTWPSFGGHLVNLKLHF